VVKNAPFVSRRFAFLRGSKTPRPISAFQLSQFQRFPAIVAAGKVRQTQLFKPAPFLQSANPR
jgi:hypothetical protein